MNNGLYGRDVRDNLIPMVSSHNFVFLNVCLSVTIQNFYLFKCRDP